MKYKDLRDYLFRGLLFEAEAVNFQKAGIQVGADQTTSEQQLLTEALSPFPVGLRNSALEMARLYSVLFAFENHVRGFIRETLSEAEGSDWLDNLPKKVKEFAEKRQKTAMEDSWLEGEKTDLLGFIDFGHLSQIIIEKWEHFQDVMPSQHWLKQRMDELEKARNFVAHNRALLPSEYQRMYMYIADWNRVVGL
ncbi:MAG: Swt1 family HEPN domain-containing protein [Candidatus Bathyarchaeia archaeon]|nr:Swt1 family HEPN domain-containing protein [Candidatus Bathyarchaeia archaeon]